jgi:hypothetical protein
MGERIRIGNPDPDPARSKLAPKKGKIKKVDALKSFPEVYEDIHDSF